MSLATTAASQTSGTTSSTTAAANPLTKLSSNFNDFLNLLTTQLKNQDPSTPLDTNQFTQELVQFSSVEQQITTNTSLTSLIQATQGNEVINATNVTGKSVTLDTDHIALQSGKGAVNFTTANAEPVAISITDGSGTKIRDGSLTSVAGANSWAWDGKDNTGVSVPDGSYAITVSGTDAGGTTAALPFTVTGTATGVTNASGAVSLQVGALSVDFSKVLSVTAP